MITDLPPSFLYVPASKPKLFEKALASQATALILDLEDSVPHAAKSSARDGLHDFLRSTPPLRKPVWVRINAFSRSQENAEHDLEMLGSVDIAGIVLPKVELASIRSVGAYAPDLPVIGLVETAQGLLQASSIAEERQLVGFGIGRADLLSELRVAPQAVSAFEQLALQIVIASAAGGLAAPIAPAHLALDQSEASESHARETSQRFYDLGFRSQTAIHPRHCELINSVFGPNEADYLQAKSLLAELENSDGTFVTTDGQFVDEAVARRYRDVVRRYEGR